MTEELKEIQDKATEVFLAKPEWAERYSNAPEGAKEYYRLMFALSVVSLPNGGDAMQMTGAAEERDRIYHSLDDASWDYLLANAGHAEAQGLYIARKKMQGKPEVKYGDWLPS